MITVGSLFSGIGGIDLGLERAGMSIKWQCEKDPWCRKVLTKHWPEVPKYEDVTTLDAATVEPVDVLAGGFPCQDLSFAGKQAGILEGKRSGLWGEFARLIRTLRPRYVLVENVPGLLIQPGLGVVLRDLAECGYDAEWQVLSARAFGAPHLRKRVWIVAYHNGQHQQEYFGRNKLQKKSRESPFRWGRVSKVWPTTDEPSVGGVAHGLPKRVDRLRGLGNAVIPQIVTFLGERIMEYDRHRQAPV